MEYPICIEDLANEIFKIYNKARPDYPASCFDVSLQIIPVRRIVDGTPKANVDFEDCKIRFKFSLKKDNVSNEVVYETNLDISANTNIKYTNAKGEKVDFKDCVKKVSRIGTRPWMFEDEFLFLEDPKKVTPTLSPENSDIKYNLCLNKAYKNCVERIEGTSK